MDYKQDNNDFNFDFENQNQPSHLSYKQYQKKVTKKNDNLVMFISVFFIMLLLFLGLDKQFSPNIDVSIGNENEDSVTEGIVQNGNVDNRLKNIQNEDKGTQDGDEEMFDPSLDEKVVVPSMKNTKDSTNANAEDKLAGDEQTAQDAKTIGAKTSTTAPKPVSKTSGTHGIKVVVGYYATAEQAEVAKGILQEAGLNVTPFIRNIGGTYTIQTGSFASRDSAQAAAAELLRNNFPARVIVE